MITMQDIVSRDNIEKSLKQATRGKFKLRPDIVKFMQHKEKNISNLVKKLLSGTYRTGAYVSMKIKDNKRRDVAIPKFRDKLVQYMLINAILDTYENRFIKDSYACIRKRGNHQAVLTLQKYLKQARYFYNGNVYLLKIDISKFFYTINKFILLERLKLVIQDTAVYELCKTIIIGYKLTSSIGLPLGNLTSQQFANIYLDYIDKYIKRTLAIKYYVRYADDFFLLLPSYQLAKHIKNKLIYILNKKLSLFIHPGKCSIRKVKKIYGLGYKIYSYFKYINNRNKGKFRKYLKHLKLLSLQGWYSYMHISNSQHWIQERLNNYNLILNQNSIIKL